MFGPNNRAGCSDINFHHRELSFHKILTDLEETFIRCFGLDDFSFLFITGNGTVVNEIIIQSIGYFKTLYMDAEFGKRLWRMSRNYYNSEFNASRLAYPLYETSISRLNKVVTNRKLVFLDMVSAFPYYMPPDDVQIWTTVSSKQLGALPVIGIIALRNDLNLGSLLRNNKYSYLNLSQHVHFYALNETFTTPAIPLYADLLETLRNFDREELVQKIDKRRDKIINAVGERQVIGEGPVITFKLIKEDDTKNAWLLETYSRFNLYKSGGSYQAFLWSGTDEQYDYFCHEVERVRRCTTNLNIGT